MKGYMYIISLKYAPGSNKEFVVLGDNFQKRNFDVRYILAHPYKDLEWVREGSEFITVSNKLRNVFIDFVRYLDGRKIMQMFSSYPPSFICFYNPHPLNPVIARLVRRKFPEAVISVYLHDPYKPDKSPYGFKKGLYIRLVEYVQALTVKYMDVVISPSEYSATLFKERFPNFKGKNYIAPLLIPDQKVNSDKERRYFSIVGGAHPATGHDTFIELVNYCAEKKLNYRFCLISSSKINGFLKNLTEKGKRILKIINKPIIKDSEINEVISRSFAVFRLDREVTQSGVIPVSFMNSTPVIARDIEGLRQHIRHKENGYLISFDSKPENIIKAMDFVKQNFVLLSKNARKSYEEIFAEWNFDKYYRWLTTLL